MEASMSFDFSVIVRHWSVLADGAIFTLSVTIVATVFGICFGTALALARLSGSTPLRRAAEVYVVFFRCVPLVQVILVFYLFAPILARIMLDTRFVLGAEVSAYWAFSFFEAAYFAEIIRAGIRGVGPGQYGAAAALGLTHGQAMRNVILPQAFRNVIPILLTQTIILLQDVSLVYAIGALDFFGAGERIVQTEFRPVEVYLFIAAVYFVVCFTLSKTVAGLHYRLTRNLAQVGGTP
jgi:glutamate/aspartate transport system permease protein